MYVGLTKDQKEFPAKFSNGLDVVQKAFSCFGTPDMSFADKIKELHPVIDLMQATFDMSKTKQNTESENAGPEGTASGPETEAVVDDVGPAQAETGEATGEASAVQFENPAVVKTYRSFVLFDAEQSRSLSLFPAPDAELTSIQRDVAALLQSDRPQRVTCNHANGVFICVDDKHAPADIAANWLHDPYFNCIPGATLYNSPVYANCHKNTYLFRARMDTWVFGNLALLRLSEAFAVHGEQVPVHELAFHVVCSATDSAAVPHIGWTCSSRATGGVEPVPIAVTPSAPINLGGVAYVAPDMSIPPMLHPADRFFTDGAFHFRNARYELTTRPNLQTFRDEKCLERVNSLMKNVGPFPNASWSTRRPVPGTFLPTNIPIKVLFQGVDAFEQFLTVKMDSKQTTWPVAMYRSQNSSMTSYIKLFATGLGKDCITFTLVFQKSNTVYIVEKDIAAVDVGVGMKMIEFNAMSHAEPKEK